MTKDGLPQNNNLPKGNTQLGEFYFLTEIIGAKVIFHGKKVGGLADVIIVENGTMPEVTHLYVSRSFGRPSLIIPWGKVKVFTREEIVVDLESIEKYEGEPREGAVLLRDHILDKKVLDTEDRDVAMVYDIELAVQNNKLYVIGADLSKYGFLRRIGFFTRLINSIYNQDEKAKSRIIPWTYIQSLPAGLDSFKGDVKLKVLKETLQEIPAVDLADILEELDHKQRMMVFNELENGHAVNTLEEINPSVQRDLISSLAQEKVAYLINKMTPGQAADLLSALSFSEAKPILKMIDPDSAKKIKSIIDKQEEKILNFATSKFLKVDPARTVAEIREEYQQLAKGKDTIMYIYVVDENGKLHGVIDIKELLLAKGSEVIKNVMIDNVIRLTPKTTLKEALRIFTRYDFRAMPITDKNHKIFGVITYRDLKNLKHRFLE